MSNFSLTVINIKGESYVREGYINLLLIQIKEQLEILESKLEDNSVFERHAIYEDVQKILSSVEEKIQYGGHSHVYLIEKGSDQGVIKKVNNGFLIVGDKDIINGLEKGVLKPSQLFSDPDYPLKLNRQPLQIVVPNIND